MNDLDLMLTWLRHQVESDKARAEAVSRTLNLYPNDPIDYILSCVELVIPETRVAERHIDRHRPRDVIADCASKLAIIDYLAPIVSGEYLHDDEMVIAERVLRDLAQGLRHRDGYDERWTA